MHYVLLTNLISKSYLPMCRVCDFKNTKKFSNNFENAYLDMKVVASNDMAFAFIERTDHSFCYVRL